MILCFTQLMAQDIVWTSTTLSSSGDNSSNPNVAMDGSGNSVAIWIENGMVMASWNPVNGSWTPPVAISNSGATSPALAMDPNGNATAIWLEGTNLQTSSASFNGIWSAETNIATQSSDPQLAVDVNGNLAAVWVSSGTIEAITKLFGQSWSMTSSPISVTTSDNPSVSIGANGTVCVVWHSVAVAGNDVVESATQSITAGVWSSPPLVIASGAFSHNYPKVAVDVNGNAAVIWYRYNPENFSTLNAIASYLPLNAQAWAIPTLLTANGTRNPADLFAKVAFDGDGNGIAFYSMSYDGATFDVEAALKVVGQNWTFGSLLVPSNPYSYQGDVSGNSLGEALVGYMVYDGTNLIIQTAETSVSGFVPFLFFSPAVTISTGTDNGTPRVASSFISNTDTLYASAAWLSFDGSNTRLIAATGNRSSVLPPTNLMVMQADPPINFGIFDDYANTVSWQASSSPNLQEYAIFRNGVFVTNVSASLLQYVDHNQVQNGAVTYSVCAVDTTLSQSPLVSKNFP